MTTLSAENIVEKFNIDEGSKAVSLAPSAVPGFTGWFITSRINRVAAILVEEEAVAKPLDVASSFGYQADVSWVLAYTNRGTTLIKPQWSVKRDWYKVSVASETASYTTSDAKVAASPLLNLFTPEGLYGTALDRTATSHVHPRRCV